MIVIGEFLNFPLWNGLCLFRFEVNVNTLLLVFIKKQLLNYITEGKAICLFYHLFVITLRQVPKAAVQKQSTPIWALVSGKLGLKSWSNKYKLYQLKTLTAIKVLNSDCNPF